MSRVFAASSILETAVDMTAQLLSWSPIGKRVAIVVDNSDDASLRGARFRGTIRACLRETDSSLFLVHLQRTLRHRRGCASRGIEFLVAMSSLHRHNPNRLLVTWMAVLFIDAPSFADQTYNQVVGSGRLMLSGSFRVA